MDRILCQAPADAFAAVTLFNRPVFQSFAALDALLRARLGPEAAALFARPVLRDGALSWTTEAAGPIRRLAELDGAALAACAARRAALGAALAELDAALAQGGAAQQHHAALLRAARIVPSAAHVFAVGGQPVLAFWGFRPRGGAGVDPLAVTPPAPVAAPARQGWVLAAVMLASLLGAGGWMLWPPAQTGPPVIVVAADPAPPPDPTPPMPEPPHPPPPVVPPPPAPAPALMKMPVQGDLSGLEGCWETNAFRSARDRPAARSVYCLDRQGKGRMTHHEGRVTCAAPAHVALGAGGSFALIDANARCSDGSQWLQDRLTCTGDADGVAQCRGQADDGSRWTSTLHRR